MKIFKLSLLVFGAVIYASNINAQSQAKAGNWCHTDQHTIDLLGGNLALEQEAIDFRQAMRDSQKDSPTDKAAPYIIPVVFHVITDNGAGFVSKADIDGVMQTMNEDFTRTNSDAGNTRAVFLPRAMSMNIEFRLAHLDPFGNCTEGIVRADSPLSTDAGDAVKAVSYWDSKKYLNIWVVNSIGGGGGGGIIAGYAQFPFGFGGGINNTYGVVIAAPFVRAGERTLTHEVGHCFSLLHTFQSGCGSNCSNSGDWICDTPPVTTSSFGCPTTNNTCSNDANGPDPYGTNVVDMIENYMSYNGCQNLFTLDQKADMESVLNSTSTTQGLDQLNTAANRAATGVADPYTPANCAPIADFTFDHKSICEGGTVTFADNSYNAIPNAWSWTFTGGSPSTSPLQNPTVTYPTAGVYSVTYQPSSTGGMATSVTKTSIITVNSLTATYAGPIIDGFESSPQFGTDWTIVNQAGSGQTWTHNTAAATTGTGSVRVRNFFNNGGDKHDLISPSYNISTATTKTLTFKQAFAKKSSANTDKLLVWWSIDCGENWSLRLPLTAASMATAPDVTAVFVPTSTQWVQRSVDLSSIGSATNVWFKFEFTEGGGNDIYLDDINIGNASVGIDDFSNIGNFNVYPNPTKSSAQISFNLIKNIDNLSIKVRNAVGQEVTNVISGQSFAIGQYTLKIDEQRKLSPGIYFIEFNADDNIKVEKLIVQ